MAHAALLAAEFGDEGTILWIMRSLLCFFVPSRLGVEPLRVCRIRLHSLFHLDQLRNILNLRHPDPQQFV